MVGRCGSARPIAPWLGDPIMRSISDIATAPAAASKRLAFETMCAIVVEVQRESPGTFFKRDRIAPVWTGAVLEVTADE